MSTSEQLKSFAQRQLWIQVTTKRVSDRLVEHSDEVVVYCAMVRVSIVNCPSYGPSC
ncbi:MAG: hypothetical protein F6K47_07265 [Symploca sp. SIO2E6]|nr:hypothetical protein [Symploca sp. SIO2E6]